MNEADQTTVKNLMPRANLYGTLLIWSITIDAFMSLIFLPHSMSELPAFDQVIRLCMYKTGISIILFFWAYWRDLRQLDAEDPISK